MAPSEGPSGGHSHQHGPAAPVSRHLRTVIAAVLVPFAAAVVVGMVVLWPGGAPPHHRSGVGFDQQTEQGRVIRVVPMDCGDAHAAQLPTAGNGSSASDGSGSGSASGGSSGPAPSPAAGQGAKQDCEKATVEVESGKDRGRRFDEVVQPDAPRRFHVKQDVVLSYAPQAPHDLQYSVTDIDRKFPLYLLAAVFAVAVVVVGRMRGVMALVALAVSFGVLTFFILPAVLGGSNPLVVAVIGAGAIMLIALYLCHGLTARTSVAVLGTLISLVVTGALGLVFIHWTGLTGNTDESTGLIHGLYPGLDMSGLLLAGVIIGSLGVLDDVTVTQTSAVWELHQADPSMGPRALYRAGIRIGRDHIASVVNTLVLAYAGAALPLLLLFTIADSGVGTVANTELVAEEIVRTLVGSIGLVASVPVTTALAALVVAADRTAPSPPYGERGGAGHVPEQAGERPVPGRSPGSRGRRRKR
ncbi:YibE/F family protein [Streptomyces fuscigenes]|nr:YibE/F family protein [Streptomyces fuscigenes]MCF3961285.1 YibE/F family protein [Streptomyces fuscigenes]